MPFAEAVSPGSSPGGWGEGRGGRCRRASSRFIPRRLGRGRCPRGASRCRPVHPQAAGERWRKRRASGYSSGSSPGGWGEDGTKDELGRGDRFIPRRLGRGRRRARYDRPRAVHPQAAGERTYENRANLAPAGSSPGGWGEVLNPGAAEAPGRFIPRRLGRGSPEPPPRSCWTVHPQAAGERGSSVFAVSRVLGSSPGGWGEGDGPTDFSDTARFIPRRLGRGCRGGPPPSPTPVHPQAAGERVAAVSRAGASFGSSPGGWGEVQGRVFAPLLFRFIPRRLGRGSPSITPGGPTTVHPQAAGERWNEPLAMPAASGSSPGGWGEAFRRQRDLAVGRFIPRRLGRGARSSRRRPSSPVHPQAAGERRSP